MSEWQPIETAPKDGTRILLFDAQRDPTTLIGAWEKHMRCWWGDSTNSGKCIVWRDATHWIPLPEPPK